MGGMPGWPGGSYLQLKPSRASYLKFARSAVPLAGVFVALAVVRMATGWSDPINRWGALALCVTVVVAALTVVDYLAHSSVTLTPTDLVMVGTWRHRRVVPRSDIGLCVLVQGLVTSPMRPPAPNLFVLRRDGSRAMRLAEGFYPEADLIALSRALGVPIDGIAGVMTAKQLRARHPRTATWVESHPWGFALLVVAAVIVVTVVVAMAVTAGG